MTRAPQYALVAGLQARRGLPANQKAAGWDSAIATGAYPEFLVDVLDKYFFLSEQSFGVGAALQALLNEAV